MKYHSNRYSFRLIVLLVSIVLLIISGLVYYVLPLIVSDEIKQIIEEWGTLPLGICCVIIGFTNYHEGGKLATVLYAVLDTLAIIIGILLIFRTPPVRALLGL